jgi:hypothetical protein
MAEPDAGFDMQAAFVRAAVELRFVHAMKDRAIDVAFASGIEYSGDATHMRLVPVSAYAAEPERPNNWS